MHAVAFQHFPCGISGCRGGTEMFAHVCYVSLCLLLGVEGSREPRLRGHSHRASRGGSCPQPAWILKPGVHISQFFGYSP